MAASPTRRVRSRLVLAGRVEQTRRERAAEGYPVTYRELARDLGVSESTLYKVRKGTRTGTKVLPRIRKPEQDVYQAIVETRDKRGRVMTQSVNVIAEPGDLRAVGIRRRLMSEARMAARPEVRAEVEETLRERATRSRREKKGTKPWTRQQIASSRVVAVRRPAAHRAIPRAIYLTAAFPRVR